MREYIYYPKEIKTSEFGKRIDIISRRSKKKGCLALYRTICRPSGGRKPNSRTSGFAWGYFSSYDESTKSRGESILRLLGMCADGKEIYNGSDHLEYDDTNHYLSKSEILKIINCFSDE